MVSILLSLGGRGRGLCHGATISLLSAPQGAEAEFLTGSSEKQGHLSTVSITFSRRQPSTDSSEERAFFLVGSFDLIILPQGDTCH